MNEGAQLSAVGEVGVSQRTAIGNRNPDFLGTVDQFALLRELGSGGFGVVYLAEDSFSKVKYALKTILPELKTSSEEMRNLREKFALVQKLYHPHIAVAHQIHQVKEVEYSSEDVRNKLRLSPGDPVMVMRYAPGETLSSWRRKFPRGHVPVAKAVEVCRQIAEALDYAHGENVIHRDIKPGNIIVNDKDCAVDIQILDFGLAAEIQSSVSRSGKTTVDTSGTRPYMAPEQWSGQDQDGRTDQYALGVVLYELVSGEVPFGYVFKTNDVGLMEHKVLHEPVLTVNSLNDTQNRALRKALAKSAADRFPTCRAFIDAFEGQAAFSESGVVAGAGSREPESEPAGADAPAEPYRLPTADEVVVQEGLRRLRASAVSVWRFTCAAFRTAFSPVRRQAIWLAAKLVGGKGDLSTIGRHPASDIRHPSDHPAIRPSDEWASVLSKMPRPKTTTLELGGGLSFEMVDLPAGTFRMGSPNGRNGEPGRQPGESLHEVRLSIPFQLAAAPVTRAKWRAVMGGDPDHRAGGGDDEPVTGVSWDDCRSFFDRLNETHPIRGYRWSFPTEAQWEFACRGGKAGPYAGNGRLDELGWYVGNSGGSAHPVRQKAANDWGFYDMHGNVWEWCADGYIPSLGHDPRTDPIISPSGIERVVRGGSWNNNAALCRSACRRGMARSARFDNVGFRVALVPLG